MQTVKVEFSKNSQKYSYADTQNVCLVGDLVIVNSPLNGYKAVKVVEVSSGISSNVTKTIVLKLGPPESMVQLEKYTQGKLDKFKEINRKLENLQKKQIQTEKYWALAQVCPEAALLLNELKKLG